MSSGRIPTGSEILDVLVRLEHDPEERNKLASGYELFRVCVAAGLLNEDSVDWLAQVLQQLHGEGLIAHGPVNGGVRKPPVWDGNWLQSAHQWRVTASGRADAALYRQEAVPLTAVTTHHVHDLFICHASEDKELVARPLCEALEQRGWQVWLDELRLTIGDSLSGGIEAALARSRFGVVILSPAFFAKPWPKRELSGLAAREVDVGTKVILPVWHNVDHHFLVQQAPILADRLGVSTTLGIERVADLLSAALERAGLATPTDTTGKTVVQPVEPGRDGTRLTIPSTQEEQNRVVTDRPRFWEQLLFVGVLVEGKRGLETKWDDHELRLPRGARRDFSEDSTPDFLSREIGWVETQAGTLDRILGTDMQVQAFGALGEHGDPIKIANLARRLLAMHESMLDWAAELRSATVPRKFRELLEATACFVDAPLREIRRFIDDAADQTSRLPELTADATEDNPVRVEMTLTLAADPVVQQRHKAALEQLTRAIESP
jgi:hypothetical protein